MNLQDMFLFCANFLAVCHYNQLLAACVSCFYISTGTNNYHYIFMYMYKPFRPPMFSYMDEASKNEF